MVTVSNYDVPRVALKRTTENVEGYGALSYTPNAYGAGYLPTRMKNAFYSARSRAQGGLKAFYSYGTPVAWLDGDKWIVPDVSYSVTTARHQSYVNGALSRNMIFVPADAGAEEIERLKDEKMIYLRGYGSRLGAYRPGPRWTLK